MITGQASPERLRQSSSARSWHSEDRSSLRYHLPALRLCNVAARQKGMKLHGTKSQAFLAFDRAGQVCLGSWTIAYSHGSPVQGQTRSDACTVLVVGFGSVLGPKDKEKGSAQAVRGTETETRKEFRVPRVSGGATPRFAQLGDRRPGVQPSQLQLP